MSWTEKIVISCRVRGFPFYFVSSPRKKIARGAAEVNFFAGTRYEIKYGDPSTRCEDVFFSGTANNLLFFFTLDSRWVWGLGGGRVEGSYMMRSLCTNPFFGIPRSTFVRVSVFTSRDEVSCRLSTWCIIKSYHPNWCFPSEHCATWGLNIRKEKLNWYFALIIFKKFKSYLVYNLL